MIFLFSHSFIFLFFSIYIISESPIVCSFLILGFVRLIFSFFLFLLICLYNSYSFFLFRRFFVINLSYLIFTVFQESRKVSIEVWVPRGSSFALYARRNALPTHTKYNYILLISGSKDRQPRSAVKL